MTNPLRARAALGLLVALGANAPALAQRDDRDPGELFELMCRRMDENFDGILSQDEWTRGARQFRRLDADRDGQVTREEFIERVRALRGEPAEPDDAPGTMEGEAQGDDAPMTPEALEFFESRIRPVLATHCYSCHSASADRVRGQLRVDGRAQLLAGGVGGPALAPGDPDGSALIEAVRYGDPLFAMPPKEKLPDEAIRDLERWVAMGAPWPADASGEVVEDTASGGPMDRDIDIEAGRAFWSFQPIERPTPPVPAREGWARSPIDHFLLASMAEAGTRPADDAEDAAWLRRVTFDLTGLPPTPEEREAFEDDRGDDRHAKVVDRLLASPAFGERFGRHWLDVARYAESSGKESNVAYPHAWRYRDWVIDAFQSDMPYDEFVTRQIAGDLLPAESAEEEAWNQIATGYLALGAKSHQTRDRRRFKLDLVDEQVDAVSQGMLGLTMSCARCHDHKFDPIPTEDYYALAGIFVSTETLYGTPQVPGNNQPGELIELSEEAGLPFGPRMNPLIRRLLDRTRDRVMDAGGDSMQMAEMTPEERRAAAARRRNQRQASASLGDLLSRFDEDGQPLASNLLAMGVREGKPIDLAVLERGEVDRPVGVAERGMPQVLRTDSGAEIGGGSGRLELARWIASPENPLTARVWANRVWLHMFGRGLVATPDNFGASGQAPTHPELLDWLASELIAKGWSTKALVREIALSSAYRLSARGSSSMESRDPDLASYWRMPSRRLEAEAIRDAMLSAAGVLEAEPPVGSPTGTLEGTLRRANLVEFVTRESNVRSVYTPALRGHVTDAMDAFDAPDAAFVTGVREVTTGATQALYLMNDSHVLRTADAFADRLLHMEGDEDDRIEAAFELALGREPDTGERRLVRGFLDDYRNAFAKEAPTVSRRAFQRGQSQRGRRQRERQRALDPDAVAPHTDAERAAWSAFAQSLFQSAEFRTLD